MGLLFSLAIRHLKLAGMTARLERTVQLSNQLRHRAFKRARESEEALKSLSNELQAFTREGDRQTFCVQHTSFYIQSIKIDSDQ